MALRSLVLVVLAGSAAVQASALVLDASAASTANPIRKVVTMLQMMQNKIMKEGKAAEELFDKFMCYCENAGGTLEKSIADAEQKIPQLESSIKEHVAMLAQLKTDVAQHKTDREEAKAAIAQAKAQRAKEADAFAKESSELSSNIAALEKAIAAISKGISGGFLQTSAARVLRQLSLTMEMSSLDRDMLSSYLSSNSEYVPQSQEIVGILKQMKDEMEKDLSDAEAAEKEAAASAEGLIAAKAKEIEALTQSIEEKLGRIGDAGVELATMKNDLEDTIEGLGEDKKFLADMEKNCALKQKEWDAYKKTQAEELLALAETIKILNDDDALELFKKTLPSASFMQVSVSSKLLRQRALQALAGARGLARSDTRFDFLELALKGQKVGFEKIIKLIDDLVALLAKEQTEDDEKKVYCEEELDSADDKKKELDHNIADLEKAIADAEESIATLKSEIEALEDGIKALDKEVAEATEQRKAEHATFTEDLAANTAAKDLLEFAKNRLNKFYNPKLYKAPPKRVLTEEERITVNMGGTLAPTAPPAGIAGTGIGLVQQHRDLAGAEAAPPPPPEANLAYKKSSESGGGVIAMIDLLKADLDKQITEMEVNEKDAQADYETFMADSAARRADDSKAITDKESAKAALEEELLGNQEALKSKQIELMETEKYIVELHKECDWLLQHFDLRKEARAGEMNALKKAKDVLSGADYSF